MKKIFLIVLTLIFHISFANQDHLITWVAIGDSITYMNEHPEEADNRITKGYMTMVKEKLPYLEYINKGFNGWTTVKFAEEFDKLTITKASIYSIFLGTNDWWHSNTLGSFEDYKNNTGTSTVLGAFKIIIEKLKALNPNAKIIFITPMQRVDFVYLHNFKNNAYGSYQPKNGQLLEDFANAIINIAEKENFSVVDLFHEPSLQYEELIKFKRLKDPISGVYKEYRYPEFITIPFDPLKDEYPYPISSINKTYDGLHPSDKGYAVIAKHLIKTIRKLHVK